MDRWQIYDDDVHDVADAISSDAEGLGAAAASIIDAHPEQFIDTVLLIDRITSTRSGEETG